MIILPHRHLNLHPGWHPSTAALRDQFKNDHLNLGVCSRPSTTSFGMRPSFGARRKPRKIGEDGKDSVNDSKMAGVSDDEAGTESAPCILQHSDG